MSGPIACGRFVEAQNLDYLAFAAKREEFPKDAALRG
jgi:hypothetical protein